MRASGWEAETTSRRPRSARTRAGRSTAVPGRDHLFLNLTLALHDAGPMPGSLDLREGRLVLHPGGRTVDGAVADWEELDIPNSVRWDVHGTDADERFLFEGILGVRIRAGSGDDEILGTPQPDTIDGGAGEDTVTAYAGRDVCERVEHTRGCDVLRPSQVASEARS